MKRVKEGEIQVSPDGNLAAVAKAVDHIDLREGCDVSDMRALTMGSKGLWIQATFLARTELDIMYMDSKSDPFYRMNTFKQRLPIIQKLHDVMRRLKVPLHHLLTTADPREHQPIWVGALFSSDSAARGGAEAAPRAVPHFRVCGFFK